MKLGLKVKFLMLCASTVILGLLGGCGGGGGSNNSSATTTNNAPITDISPVIKQGVSTYNSLISSGVGKDVAVNNTVNWYKSQTGVSNAYPAADNRNIFIQDKNGMTTLFITESSSSVNKASFKNRIYNTSLNLQSTSSMKAIVLDPFNISSKNSSVVNTLLSNNQNIEVTYLKGADVTPEIIQNLSEDDLIYYVGHGGIDKSNWDTIFIGTGVPFSEASIAAYAAKYGGNKYKYFGKMITGDNQEYILVNSYFVADYSKGLKATVVYIDACHSLDADTNDMMAKAFIENGAKSYLGWSADVMPWLGVDTTYRVAESLFTDILACKSVQTAFSNLPFDWNFSDLHYRGDGKLPICDIPATDLSFAISGTIRSGSNSGPVLSGATVSIAGKTAITSSTGTYTITNIPAGTYSFSVSKAGYDTYTNAAYPVGSNLSGLSNYLTQSTVYYAMSGTIRSGSNSGPVLSGATVSIAGKTTTTSSTGTYSFTGIPAGSYIFTVSKAGYDTFTSSAYPVGSSLSGLSNYLTFSNVARFVGNWINVNPDTRGITRVNIENQVDKLYIHMWGSCDTAECDWGIAATSVDDSADGVLSITWTPGYAIRTQQLTVIPDGHLQVVDKIHFTDTSGRADQNNTYYFGNNTASSTRFINKGNGTIYDAVSNLTWLKNADCFERLPWFEAMTQSYNLASGQCGLSDGSNVGSWHLPTLNELRMFVDAGYRSDTLNAVGFLNVKSSYYWSATSYTASGSSLSSAWVVDMYNGLVGSNYKSYYGPYLWPVRSGQ